MTHFIYISKRVFPIGDTYFPLGTEAYVTFSEIRFTYVKRTSRGEVALSTSATLFKII